MIRDFSVILLAAGKSSRFWPLNYRHKSLFKLMGKTVLEHLLTELMSVGFREFIVVSSPNDRDEIEKIVDKIDGIDISVAVQKEPKGMWDAISVGAKKASLDQYIVLNAHKLNVSSIVKKLMVRVEKGSALAITETDKPQLYGVVKVRGNKIIDVVEKPRKEEAPSNLRIVGVYRFSKNFLDFMESVAEEEESEYKLEYALSKYARDKGLRYVKVDYEPLSLRYPWDVFRYLSYLLNKLDRKVISEDAEISKWAAIEGPVWIDEGAKVSRHASVVGPAYIGKNAFVGDNSVVRESDLESNSVVGAQFEMARSILQVGATTHSGYLGDSIVGEETKIGAGFISANIRLDGKTVKCYVKGEKIDTGLRKLGVIIGKKTSIGIHVGTMPGVFIGNEVIIGPGKMVYRNVMDGEKLL